MNNEIGLLFAEFGELHRPAGNGLTACGHSIPAGAVATTRLAAEVFNISVCHQCWPPRRIGTR